MERKGLVIVYTGPGKGKTTASLGMAIRALGHGMKVLIVQFLKSAEYGEHKVLKKLQGIDLYIGGKGFCRVCGDNLPFSEHKSFAQNSLSYAYSAVISAKYDMVVLDEINCATSVKLIKVSEVMKLIRNKPENLHLVLTGRGAPKSVVKAADLVSEIIDIKHSYAKGVQAQVGVEF